MAIKKIGFSKNVDEQFEKLFSEIGDLRKSVENTNEKVNESDKLRRKERGLAGAAKWLIGGVIIGCLGNYTYDSLKTSKIEQTHVVECDKRVAKID